MTQHAEMKEGDIFYFVNKASKKRIQVIKSGNVLIISADGALKVQESLDYPGKLIWIWAENEEG